MNKIDLSIIIPAYNVQDYIQECTASIFPQVKSNIEVIIINDGSTDKSLNIIKSLKNKPLNLKLINQENVGLGKTRNTGVQHSSGKYIFFVDADDIIPPHSIAKNLDKCLKTCPDIFLGTLYRYKQNNPQKAKLAKNLDFTKGLLENYKEHPEIINATSPCDKFFKRSFWMKNNFYFEENKFYEEIFVITKALIYAKSILLSPNPIYYWRIRNKGPRSITQNRNQLNNIKDRLYAIKKVKNLIDKHCQEDTLSVFYTKLISQDTPLFLSQLPYSNKDFQIYFWNSFLPFLHNCPKTILEKICIKLVK